MATTVGALGFGAAGLGGGVASAVPAAPVPMKPGHGHDDPWPQPGQDNNGPGWQQQGDWNQGNWIPGDSNQGDWNKGQWLATNRHDWWDDRNGPPPWGWGPPPPAQWPGSAAVGGPHPINYWGWNANPVWDDGFHAWRIWLFGLWIPLIGVGVS